MFSTIFCLVTFAGSLKPVVFLPPLLGTELHGSAHGLSSYWYCSSDFDDEVIWVNEGMLVPPFINCYADYLSSDWDDAHQTVTNRTNTTTFITDFGGTSSISFIDSGLFDVQIIPSLGFLINYFKSQGYVEKVDLFGAPYDWRHNPLYLGYFWDRLQSLIEDAYTTNGNAKVALFAYSAGGLATHYFLTRKVTQEWKDKYLDRVVFASSSMGGSMSATQVTWLGHYPFIPDSLMSDSLHRFFTQSPTLFAQYPNWHVNPDQVLLRGPDGEFRAKDVQTFMKAHGKYTEIGQKQSDAAETIYNDPLEDPGVNAYMLFNGAIATPQTMQWNTSYDDDYEMLKAGGDDTMLKETLQYPCGAWKQQGRKTALACHDVNVDSEFWSHILMLSEQEYIELAYQTVTSDEWVVPGVHYFTGKTTDGWSGLKDKKAE
jgi:lecithin-cholesterol acyltransferase